MEQVKVLGVEMSPFAMHVLIALEEKGVKYECQEEDLSYNKSCLLLQMNPVYKKVPVLIHNGKPICESLIILEYIDDTWGSEKFSPYDRTLARFWADFIDKKFLESTFRVVHSKDEAQEQGKCDMLDIAFIPFASFFHAFETIGNFKILFESEYALLDVWVKKCIKSTF